MAIKQNEHERHDYAATLVWTGAKHGATTSYQSYSREYEFRVGDKAPMRGSADTVFRGDASLYNPEELLVVSLSSCHLLSYLAVCSRAGVHVAGYEDEAAGVMTVHNGKVCFTDVLLRLRVTVAKGTDVEKARALHDTAHDECYIANSVNFPVRHEVTIVVAD